MRIDQKDVLAFHEKFQCTLGESPGFRDEVLRLSLIMEELEEFVEALGEGDFVQAIKELCDLKYVLNGTAVAWGVDLEGPEWAVHQSNMAKEGGGQREDGKILKPEGWEPPDIEGLLRRQGWEPEDDG